MYERDNPVIATGMRGDDAIFLRGALFALCSIRQKITNVPAQIEAIESGDYSDLFGFKLNAYTWLSENAPRLRRAILSAPDNRTRMILLCECPGLGIVKAAFVLQLMGYDVACLDSRNVKREGRNPRAYRTDGARKTTCARAFLRKIDRYLAEVEGKAREYWNAWCEDVAAAYKLTAEEVSGLHLAVVGDDYVPF